jgi:polar amino acid transport system substrate-binding protein
MKLKTGITMGLAFLAALIFTTSAYANGSTQKFRTVDQIKKSGTLVMYTDAGWPPYEYIGENGQPDGIDIDISKRVAKDLGVKLQITNAAFDGFPIALMNGQADMAASAITINAERKETLDFSIPYTVSVQSIIVKDSDTTTKCLNDLKGKKTGVYLGTTGDFLVSDAIQKGVLKGTGATVLQ